MKFDAERSQIWSVFNALPLTDDIAFCRPNQGLHWTRLVPRPHRLGWTPSLFPLQPRLRNFISFLKTQHVGFWGLTAPVNPPTSGKPLMESLPFTNISCLPRSRPQEKQSQCVRTASGAPPPPPAWPAALRPCSCPSLWGAHPEIPLLRASGLFYAVFLQQPFPI